MWRLGVVPVAVLLLTACDTGAQSHAARPSASPEPALTLQAAVQQAQGWLVPDTFPAEPGTEACRIPHGGDYLAAEQTVPGICETAAIQLGRSEWLVTLVETWDARDFGLPGATGKLWHGWNFLAVSGQVLPRLLTQAGDFPPQYGF